MLEGTVGINGNDDIFGDGHTLCWSPSDLSGWHCLLHICIQSVGLLSCESVEYSNTSITASLSDIFVVGLISYAESLSVEGAKGILVGDFDI